MIEEKDPDGFRDLEDITSPDKRQSFFATLDKDGYRPITLKDFYGRISKINISDSVPREIRIHFNTAKNIALYSWFVYRFGPVADHQAFVSFEFALREKLKDQIVDKEKMPGFKFF